MEKITEKGVLKYRMPNILEAYDILEASEIANGNKSILKLKKNIIKEMAFLLDYSQVEGVASYEEMLNDLEFTQPLSEIADEIAAKAFDAFKKKPM
jgi:hypothetical protein